MDAEAKKQRETDLARIRKRRQREKEKAARADDVSDSENTNSALMRGAKALATTNQITDVACLSRPLTQGWKSRTGTQAA
jgi:hypothetical protein